MAMRKPEDWKLKVISNPKDMFYINYSSLVKAEMKFNLISKPKEWYAPVRMFLIEERKALFEERIRTYDWK
jgi:hypothetical protein